MSYSAIIVKLRNVRSVPELNNLNVATVHGDQVLVGKDYKDGDIGVYFRGGGIISDRHLTECQLYAKRGWIVEDPGQTDLKVGEEITVERYREIKLEITRDLEKNYSDFKVKANFTKHDEKHYYVEQPNDTEFEKNQIVTKKQVQKSNMNIDKENAKIIREQVSLSLPKGKTINRGGSFDTNRVKVVKFQGVESHGFWQPFYRINNNGDKVFNFAWTGEDVSWFTEGKEFTHINNYKICDKYYTKAEIRALKELENKSKQGQRVVKGDYLLQHYETPQLINAYIPANSFLIITEKLHGTSGRTGYVPEDIRLTGIRAWWNNLAKRKNWNLQFPEQEYRYISGTRRVIVNNVKESGYYEGTTFRYDIHNKISSIGLKKGETLYYEIVGFTEIGTPLMSTHKVKDDKLKKKFGETMTYSYGCRKVEDTFLSMNSNIDPRSFIDAMKEKLGVDIRLAECKIYVYRITNINSDGDVIELSWDAVKRRCNELGIDHVPELTRMVYDGDSDALTKVCIDLGTRTSTLDSSHLMEGVCIRVSNVYDDTNFKFKNFFFKQQEDIMKDDEHFVDPEDIA